MKLKTCMLLIMFLFLSIQLRFLSCDNGNEDVLTSPIYETNSEYFVSVRVVSFGGVSGCSSVSVYKGDEPIDAEVRINEVLLSPAMESTPYGLYEEDGDSLSYSQKMRYDIEVTRNDTLIAYGTTYMPTNPTITNLPFLYYHKLNKDLNIKWTKSQYATSLEIIVYWENEDGSDMIFDTGLISPNLTSYTVPDTVFSKYGMYAIGITAFNGINAGMDFDSLSISNNDNIGCNIHNSRGSLVAVNMYPNYDGLMIYVDSTEANLSKMVNKKYTGRPIGEIFEERILNKLSHNKSLKKYIRNQ
ncbi:MAG: hypothetical protein PHW79_05335 [Candidatus Marinimicrobia bacterium]|nr:hypothetical protein [Candidatus Neomarinimicrobiota bacterium]